MNDQSFSVVFLPGAGNHPVDLEIFRIRGVASVDTVWYPTWQRYTNGHLSVDDLIADLAAQVEAKVPSGAICLVGLSLGGHLGYATALHLQARGREVIGFCPIDSFMIQTSEPTSGWQGRALAEGLELLRTRRIGEFVGFIRSRLWRLLVRLTMPWVPTLLSKLNRKSNSPALSAVDPILETELTMRLLLRNTAPWLASLDRNPQPLTVPSLLLRTSLTAQDDKYWIARCPNIQIVELPGQHHTLFEAENVHALQNAFQQAAASWCSEILPLAR